MASVPRRGWRTLVAALLISSAFSAAAQAPPCGIESVAQAERTVVQPDQPAAIKAMVALPDPLPLALRSERVRIAYRVDVSRCAATPAAAVWIFRVGAPYRISAGGAPLALLNANALASTREGNAGVYNGRIPALFALPAGVRDLRIELQTLPYIPAGLVRLDIGPTNQLLALHAQMVHSVVGYADVAAGVVLVLGLVSLLLWLPRRGDLNLLWLALA
ncbi:MAG: hypothetical protein ABI907_10860, partial [Ramlibacter sp.]